jgi:hypothetical protein
MRDISSLMAAAPCSTGRGSCPSGQQEAALAALGIDEFGDQVAQVVLKLLRTDCLDVSSRRRWLPVSDAISTASVSMMPLTSSRCFARVGNAWPLRITG